MIKPERKSWNSGFRVVLREIPRYSAVSALVVAVNLFILVEIAYSTDFTSSNFIVRDPVMSSGGVYSTSDTFRLYSSFGQTGIGRSTSDSRELRAGFLYFAAPAAAASPTPTPSPTPPPGGGPILPSQNPPVSGAAPPITPPPLIPPLISFITGERIPVPGCGRSDLNCDGRVDLQDLSILLSRPRVTTGRTLSLLFSDWTRRLPVPPFTREGLFRPPEEPRVRPPAPGLAQVVSVVAPTTTPPAEAPPKISIFKAIWKLMTTIVGFILRIFGF